MFRFLLIVTLCIGIARHSFAQKIKKEDYFIIDEYARKAGSMKGCSIALIADSLSAQCKDELQMTRAFYYWSTHFIDFDIRRYRHPDNASDNASTALMDRKAASQGYAEIFKALCDWKKIECIVVKGVVRQFNDDIGSFDEDEISYWNIVTVNHTRYVIDVSMGPGYLDEKGKHFAREFTDAWWLTNRKSFAFIHFPDKKEMQNLEVPLTRTEFAQAPILAPWSIVVGLIPPKGMKGLIKGVADTNTTLKFNFAGHLNALPVFASYDKGPKIAVASDFDEFGFYIVLPNGAAGEHIVQIYLGSKLAFTFKTEMKKAKLKVKR